MNTQLLRLKIFKSGYRLIYGRRLFRFRIFRPGPRRAGRIRKRIEKYFPRDDALLCLSKDEIFLNKQVQCEKDVPLPTKVIEHFIDKSSYCAILNFCPCRDANACEDYPKDLGCLFLGEAAKKIHPDKHRAVTKEEAKAHIWRARDAGLVHLTGRANFDAMLFGVSPHDRLYTVCSCCPCCCISRAVPYVAPEFVDWFYRMPGIHVEVTGDCVACGRCPEACIYGGIVIAGDKAVITEHCRACGRCVEVCKKEAIKFKVDDDYIDQAIAFLSGRVEVS